MKCLQCAQKWNTIQWMRTGQSSQVCKAKVHIYFDSVLCLGKTQGSLQSTEGWTEKNEWFTNALEYRDLDCIDGGAVEIPGHTMQLLREIQRKMEACRCPTTSIGEKTKTKKLVFRISEKLRRTQENFLMDITHFGPGTE